MGDFKLRAEQVEFFRASFVRFQEADDVSSPITPGGVVSNLLPGLPCFYTGIPASGGRLVLLENDTIG